jgi:hypothetical protein
VSPRPFVRAQGVALTITLAAVAAAGQTLIAIVGTAITLVIWLALRLAYRRKRSGQPVHPSTLVRHDLDRLVDKVTVVSVLVPIGVIVARVIVCWSPLSGVSAIVAAISIVLITGGLFWSSLVDWYWVLPRVSGMLGARPCRRGDSSQQTPVTSWDVVTSLWYGHRTASAITVILGAGGLTGAIIGATSSAADADPTVTKALAILAGVVPFVAGTIMKRVPLGFAEAIRPTFTVGTTYAVPGATHTRWVVDVSLEGPGTVDVAEHRLRFMDRRSHDQSQFGAPKHDRVVPLKDLDKESTQQATFADCANGTCCGINWYCVENVRFAEKP